jgi:predicted kinase
MEKSFLEIIQSEIPGDALLISVGLPGSWKSPVTEEIAGIKGFDLLRTDLIRLEVLKGLDIFDGRVASDPDNRKRVYEEMFRRGEKTLAAEGRGLILDATFFTRELRFRAAEIADRAGRSFVIVECVCSEDRSIQRILKRTKANYESNALTREAYLNNKALFQPVDIEEIKRTFEALSVIHIAIDTEYDPPSEWKIKKIEKR